MMDDHIGRLVLEDLNGVARTCNEAYDAVNNRSATPEQLRARVTSMREHLDRIEAHLVNNTVLASVDRPR